MATCNACGKVRGVFEGRNGLCDACYAKAKTSEQNSLASKRAKTESHKFYDNQSLVRTAKDLVVTTETFVGDVERLDVVATEVVLGMNIFKDVLANVRDIFGGRSGTVQNTLEEARLIAFEDLRMKAAKLGADAVIAVDIDYNSISTGSGINMMMVSVSGTAIRWKSTS